MAPALGWPNEQKIRHTMHIVRFSFSLPEGLGPNEAIFLGHQ